MQKRDCRRKTASICIRPYTAEDVDIDVIDDYDERCWIAKCGAYKLTDEAVQKFHRVLDIDVDMRDDIAVLHCETEREAEECKDFFLSLAGYCSSEDYDRWFVEV